MYFLNNVRAKFSKLFKSYISDYTILKIFLIKSKRSITVKKGEYSLKL